MKAFLLFTLLLSVEAKALTLKAVTTEFPPYQILSGEEVRGISTDIVKNVVELAGFKAEFKGYPWARAYRIAQKEDNVIIYSMARTPEREKLFKWVGTIVPYNVYFWKLRKRTDVSVKSLEDAKRYAVGGTTDDIKAIELIKFGFLPGKNLEMATSDEVNIRKLFAGRITLMPYDEISFINRVTRAGYDFTKTEKLIRMDTISHDLYIAVSLQTSDDVVKKLSASLESFKKTAKFKELQDKIKKHND